MGGGGGGEDSLIRVSTDVRTRALGISGVNFCPGIRSWEVNFAQALGFRQFLTKCAIFDKRVKKVIHLLKIFNFGTLQVMKTYPVVRFLAVICPGIRFLSANFARPRFCTLYTSVPTFIRDSPPLAFIQLLHACRTKIHVLTNPACFNSYMTLNNFPSILYYLDEKEAFV